jgi:hypothetical protein
MLRLLTSGLTAADHLWDAGHDNTVIAATPQLSTSLLSNLLSRYETAQLALDERGQLFVIGVASRGTEVVPLIML